MRVCEPLEGISSWSGWFLVAKLKPMRSTSEGQHQELGKRVLQHPRVCSYHRRSRQIGGASCTRRVLALRIDRLERVVNSKHTYNTRTWNQSGYIITDSFFFHRPSTLKRKTSIDILLFSYLAPNQRTTLSIGSQMVELLLGARLGVVEMPVQCKMSCRSVVIRGSWFNFCTAGNQLDSFLCHPATSAILSQNRSNSHVHICGLKCHVWIVFCKWEHLCPPSPSSKPVDRCSLGWLIFVEMEEPTWRWRRLRMHFPKVTLAARYHSRHCMFHGLWRYCQADGSVVCWGNPDFGGDASATAHMLKHSVVEAWLFFNWIIDVYPPEV